MKLESLRSMLLRADDEIVKVKAQRGGQTQGFVSTVPIPTSLPSAKVANQSCYPMYQLQSDRPGFVLPPAKEVNPVVLLSNPIEPGMEVG